MKIIKHLLCATMLFMSMSINAQEQQYFKDPNPAIQQRLEEWQDLKFGLLMHWGPYSQWGCGKLEHMP